MTKVSALSLLLSLLICGHVQAQTKPLPVPKVPTVKTEKPLPPAPQNPSTQNASPDEESDDSASDETPEEVKPTIGDTNPLDPVGDSLEKLIELRVNGDLWKFMLGKLPCLETSEECIGQLQNQAISNSPTLKAIDERIEVINKAIAEATKNNQQSVKFSVFEPLVRSYLTLENVPVQPGQPPQKRGFLNKLFDIFIKPVGGINEILSLIGLPLFQNATGTNNEAQQRNIAIGDLQAKVAEIQNKRGELADKIREQVVLSTLDFEVLRRDFQISQEIARRDTVKMKLIEVGYRFGEGDTTAYLNQLSGLDKQKAETYRQWARMRSQMARIKLLVLGAGEE